MKRICRWAKRVALVFPWLLAVAAVVWKFSPEITRSVSFQPTPVVKADRPVDAGLTAFLREAVVIQTEVYEYLEGERERSMKHAYTQGDLESEVAKRLNMSVNALRTKVAEGEGSPDALTRSYALLLSGQRISALAEAMKARDKELDGLGRLRDAYWVESRIHLADGSRHLALEALTAGCALTDEKKDSVAWAAVRCDLARVLVSLGRYAEAEEQFGKVYEVRRVSAGDSDPETILALGGVATTRLMQGKEDEGRSAMSRVSEIRWAGLEVDHPEIAVELRGKAKEAFELEQYAEAEPLFREILAVFEQKFGPDHVDVAINLHNLAGVMHLQEKKQEAEPLHRRSLKLFLNYRKANKAPHRHEESCLLVFRRLLKNLNKPDNEIEAEIAAMRKDAGLIE